MRPENPLPRISGDLISAAMSQFPEPQTANVEFMEGKAVTVDGYEVIGTPVTGPMTWFLMNAASPTSARGPVAPPSKRYKMNPHFMRGLAKIFAQGCPRNR